MIPPAKLPTKPAPKVGECIGRGAYKQAFYNATDASKVILRSHRGGRTYDNEWASEIKMLHMLDSLGFPVLQVHDFFIGEDSITYMIVDRHNAGRGDNKVGQTYHAHVNEMYKRVNGNTVKSIRQIVRATQRSWVYEIGDFQYLWADDGRIVINDPHIYISRCASQDEWNASYKGKDLWYSHLRAYVERVHAEKTGVIPPPAKINEAYCQDVYTNASIWWKQCGKDLVTKQIEAQKALEELEARAMAVMGIPTINYRWVEIGHST